MPRVRAFSHHVYRFLPFFLLDFVVVLLSGGNSNRATITSLVSGSTTVRFKFVWKRPIYLSMALSAASPLSLGRSNITSNKLALMEENRQNLYMVGHILSDLRSLERLSRRFKGIWSESRD